MSWPEVNLNTVVKLDGGYAFKSKDFSVTGIPIVRISNLTEGKVVLNDAARIPEAKVKTFGLYELFPGDVLIAMSGATTGKLGQMPKTLSSRVLLNQRVGRFRVLSHENLDYGYLKYFLNSPRFQGKVKDTAAGAAQPNISGKQIEAIPIPLPPLPIQKKIAAVLEKADELRKKRQEQIKRLDDLLQATFLDMFGDPVTNPKGWETAKICDFAEVKIGPFGSLLHVEDYIEDGVPLINPSHIVDGEINPDPKLSLTAKKFEELSAYALLKNDVVIGRRGEIGRCAVVRKEPFFCGTGSMLIRTKNSLLPDILQNILSSSQVREKLTNEAVGVTMKNLNAGIIKNLVVPLPPTNLQKHFLDFSKKVNLRKVEMQFAKNKISEGFNSLMQDAFKGELDLT